MSVETPGPGTPHVPNMPEEASKVLQFWLGQDDKVWFSADPDFDSKVAKRFGGLVERARSGALDHWAEAPESAVALVVLLDQMTRNIYRDSPDMFAGDAQALAVAKRAIARGFDRRLANPMRQWLYMPFMHSEDLEDQQRCIALFAAANMDKTLPFAEDHADIIRRFGRFPHRNALLGREMTPDEARFLAEGGFSGVSRKASEGGQGGR